MPAPAATASQDRGAPQLCRSPPARLAGDLEALGQPAQAEQDQHRRDDLDQQLREGEVGRGEPDEGDAGDEPGAAEQDERGEPVELGLLRGAERACARRRSRAARRRDRRLRGQRPGSKPVPVERPAGRRAPR